MTVARRVVVVEDDPKIAQLLVDYLRADGFAPVAIDDGALALLQIKRDVPAAILLDVMLPGLDGVSVCRAVRAFSDVPILMVTARVEEVDRLVGLETGADDYVCKPFSPREVVARVRALVRRAEGALRPPAKQAWTIDDAGQRIAWRGHWLPLTAVELRLFRRLLDHPGRVFSRAQLQDDGALGVRDASDRAIDSHVKNLRRKLDAVDPGCACIAAVYGAGYRFDAPP